jgi:iron-sulfur cluster assembly protein
MQPITKEMTIDEILTKFPDKAQMLAQAMKSFGLNCVGCGASIWETLEAGVLGHGLPTETLETLLFKLNNILKEKNDTTTITLTKKAAHKYKEILKEESKIGWGLRFFDKAAGCSGFEYVLEFSEKPLPTDQVFISEGVEIHVDRSAAYRLIGSVIEFVDGLNDSGFKISNPNVKASCGCGKSQNY